MSLNTFPRQKIPFSKKNREWRKQHLDFADRASIMYDSTVRARLTEKKI